MLKHEYQGHWRVDGRKPYMVYTQTGGTSYAAENAASAGWTDREWKDSNCDSYRVLCRARNPSEAITRAQWSMMYDDAHADWGHHDNILGESHRAVNIGVATNGKRVTFVQHFEGGAAVAAAVPVLLQDNRLSLEMVKQEPGISIGGVVSVYYDPVPTTKTPEEIDRLDSYCLGGGFTTKCSKPMTRILKPPTPGSFYSDLAGHEVVADQWRETAKGFSFRADVGTLLRAPGVYTIVVWRDAGGAQLSEALVELSVFVE